MNLMQRLWKEEDGAMATEYAIIVAILGITLVAILATFRDSISQCFADFSDEVSSNQ